MFFKTDAERAAAQASRARQDATEAGASAASGARNLGAAVLATLAEATAPKDDTSGRRHAQKARAKALKAASKDRASAAKAAEQARAAAGEARKHGRAAAEKQGAQAEKRAAKLAKDTRARGKKTAKNLRKQSESWREQGGHAAEALRDRGSEAWQRARETGPLGEAAAAKAGAGAAALAGLAATTRDRAVAGVDHGIDVAVPRAQEGVAGLAPTVDHVRDLINDEFLPKIQEMLAEVQSGKDRLLAQEEGVVATVTGAPKAPRRKGGKLIALGILAAVGAGVAWWLSQQQSQPAADPWASKDGRPDPWAGSTTSTASTPSTTAATATTTGAVGGAAGASTMEGETTMSNDGQARMLDTEQIDDLGTETPSSVEEQAVGESPTEEIQSAREHSHDTLPHNDNDNDDDGDGDERPASV